MGKVAFLFVVAEQVLERPRHHFEGQTMQLKIYRERLGIIPNNHDTSQPSLKIPADLIVRNIDPNLIQYVKDVPEAKKHLENGVMKKLNAKIDWNHKKDTELRISCSIRKEDKDARSLVKDWDDAVRQSTQFFISTISMEKRECLKNTWAEVCTEVKKISKGNHTIAVIERDAEHTLYIVGPGKTVKKVHQQVDQMCSEMEEKLDYLKDTVQISVVERSIIKKTGLVKNMEKEHPKLKITMAQEGLIFEGPPRDLLNSQKELNSFLRSLERKELNVSMGHQKVLTMLRKQPDNPIDKAMAQYKAVIHAEGQKVVLVGVGNDVIRCQEVFSTNIKEATIQVAHDEITAFRERVWANFANGMYMKCTHSSCIHVEFVEEDSAVNIVAYWEDMSGVLEDIKMHIKKNAIKEVFMDTDVPHTRMITQWMARDIMQIEKDFQSCHIQITGQVEGFQIKGTEEGLEPVKTRITQLTEKIIKDTHTVTTPGMPYYFTQLEQGMSFIKIREDTYQVIIHYETPNSQSKATKKSSRQAHRISEEKNALEEVSHASGVVIKVFVGDITSHKVDGMVNAANSQLQHYGGLARAIANKGKLTKLMGREAHNKWS